MSLFLACSSRSFLSRMGGEGFGEFFLASFSPQNLAIAHEIVLAPHLEIIKAIRIHRDFGNNTKIDANCLLVVSKV